MDGDRLVRTIQGQTMVTQLDDIAEIYMRVSPLVARGPVKGIQQFAFVTRSGQRFSLGNNVSKYEEIGNRLVEITAPRLVQENQTALRNGGVARFGPISLSSTEITITVDRGALRGPSTQMYAWKDVSRVAFELGNGWQSLFVVYPYNRGAMTELREGKIAAAAQDIPNIRALIDLLQGLNVRIGGTEGGEFLNART